jgi:hypothetical protein
MTSQNFDHIVRGFCRRQPFRRFQVQLATGEWLTVTHPEALAVRDGVAFFVDSDRSLKFFDSESVNYILYEPYVG